MKYFFKFFLTFCVWIFSYFFVSFKISNIAKQSHIIEKSNNVEIDKNRLLSTEYQTLISEDRICKLATEKYKMLPVDSKEINEIDISVAYSYQKGNKKIVAFFDKFISKAYAEEINENKFH